MTSARSRVEGHGGLRRSAPASSTQARPSVNDVGWIPTGAAPAVPACAVCMRQVNDNVQPPARLVRAGGELVPFYHAPPHFESWFGGYFGGARTAWCRGSRSAARWTTGSRARAIWDRLRLRVGLVRRHRRTRPDGRPDRLPRGGDRRFLTGGELPESPDASPFRWRRRQGRARDREGGGQDTPDEGRGIAP